MDPVQDDTIQYRHSGSVPLDSMGLPPAREDHQSSNHKQYSVDRLSRVENILRHWNLYVLYLFITNRMKRNQDDGTVVIVKDRWTTAVSMAVYLLPLGSMTALSYFINKQYFIGSELAGIPSEDNFKFFALQVAAKLLELLVVACLKSIVFTLVRRELTRGRGMPFSALTAAGQIADPSFLWSKEFVALCMGDFAILWKRLAAIITMIVCIVLAIAVAPASATAMMPKNGTWPAGGTNMYFNDTPDHIFPAALTDSHVVDETCAVAGSHALCPSTGWNVIHHSLMANIPNQLENDTFRTLPLRSVLVKGAQSILRLRAGMRGHHDTHTNHHRPNTLSTAIMPHIAIADATVNFSSQWDNAKLFTRVYRTTRWGYGKAAETGSHTYSPAAFTMCKYSPYDSESHSMPLIMNYTGTEFLGVSTTFDASTREWITNLSNLTTPELRWFTVPQDISLSPSIGALIAVPNPTATQIFGCVTSARWKMSRITADHTQCIADVDLDKDGGNIIDIDTDGLRWLGNNSTLPWRHVQLQPSFARYLNPWMSFERKSTVLQEFVTAAGMWHPTSDMRLIPGFKAEPLVETFLNLMVVNGMSRSSPYLQQIGTLIHPNGSWWKDMLAPSWRGLNPDSPYDSPDFGNNAHQIAPEDQAKSFTVRMYALESGYAYTPYDTATRVSMTVLYACMLVITIFIVFSLVTGISSSSWKSPAELLALALNSPQQDKGIMESHGTDTTTIKSMKRMYSFREEDDKVELALFKEDDPCKIKHSHFDVAGLLVEHGASISIEEVSGSTPIDLAILHGEEALGFIKSRIDDFTLSISRRASSLAVTPNPSPNLTAMGTRKALVGSLSGRYEYISWLEGQKEPFSIDILGDLGDPNHNSLLYTFSNTGKDQIGAFQLHGFVDFIGIVWFAKLYKKSGWLYRGRIDLNTKSLKGT
ncbi:hypothetical protein F5Y13DRAFT_201619 [Hypoxylon sp. FL1857]|nr:hypothetical protein F5Y13DRAFT_201619 [Hypoxylon sp. FL1857]